MLERIFIISMAFFLDLIFGDPYGLWHPIRSIGALITKTESMMWRFFSPDGEKEKDKIKKMTAGVFLVIIVIFISVAVPALLLYVAGKIHYFLKVLLSVIMCYQLLAVKSLKVESMKVYDALNNGDIHKAREAVSMIVGRDTEHLTEEGVTKAAVETVAENTSDGVTAPLLFMILFGPLGGFFYKSVNTMDSMVGYKNDKYFYFGRAAAKLDDILNYIPARVSAVLMILSAYLLGMNGDNAIQIYKRDRKKHASPNSAQTEAVCAGALEIRLAGDAYYFGKLCKKPYIGADIREPEPDDIVRANKLLYLTSVLVLGLGVIGMIAACVFFS